MFGALVALANPGWIVGEKLLGKQRGRRNQPNFTNIFILTFFARF